MGRPLKQFSSRVTALRPPSSPLEPIGRSVARPSGLKSGLISRGFSRAPIAETKTVTLEAPRVRRRSPQRVEEMDAADVGTFEESPRIQVSHCDGATVANGGHGCNGGEQVRQQAEWRPARGTLSIENPGLLPWCSCKPRATRPAQRQNKLTPPPARARHLHLFEAPKRH